MDRVEYERLSEDEEKSEDQGTSHDEQSSDDEESSEDEDDSENSGDRRISAVRTSRFRQGFIENPQNDDQYLHNSRLYQEFKFRLKIELENVHSPMVSTKPSLLNLEELRDISNKCVAVYFSTDEYSYRDSGLCDLHNFLSQQWFEKTIHDKDINFKRFLAKVIQIGKADDDCDPIDDIRVRHQAICEEFEKRKAEFLAKDKVELEKAQLDGHEPEPGQYDHQRNYTISRIFRSVFIIVVSIHDKKPKAESEVIMMKTGIKDGLAISINFDGIKQINHSPNSSSYDTTKRTDTIRTTLGEAVAFIMKLNKALENRFPLSAERDPRIIDPGLGKSIIPCVAKTAGYKGGKIVGPSTNWVDADKSHHCERCHCNFAFHESLTPYEKVLEEQLYHKWNVQRQRAKRFAESRWVDRRPAPYGFNPR